MTSRHDVRRSFIQAYKSVRPLLVHDRLRERWDAESALKDFSTRGLAGHLVRAGVVVLNYLKDAPPEFGEPIAARDYYATVLPQMDAGAHASVVGRGEELAGDDPDSLLATYESTLERLNGVLATEPPQRRMGVYTGMVVTLDDYLLTRIVEILVHADDLAVSLDLELPEFDHDAFALAIDHLVDVARAMHGDRNVLIALTRRERDSVDALRVFRAPPARDS